MADLFFEDVEAGICFETGARTITETDIVNFAGISGDFHKLHTDAEYARHHTPHGRRIAHGMLVVSVTTGLLARSEFMRAIETSTLGVREIACQFKRPVFIGDTVRVIARITECSESRKPGRGAIRMLRQVLNQDGDVVVEIQWSAVLSKRPA